MADNGKQILDGSTFSAWGQRSPSLARFRQYFEILNRYRSRLVACGIDFSSLPSDKDGAYWEKEYHKEDDIDIKAFRDTAAGLKDAGQGAQAQADLIQETEDLHEHWNDNASRAVLDNYLTNQAQMNQDLNDLRDQAATTSQQAESIEHALDIKATDASKALDALVNSSLRNNLADFDTRLRTACEAMEANNQGGSGPLGLGSNQHRYQHHGSEHSGSLGSFDLGGGGDNWPAAEVRSDIQNSVISGFAATCKTLDESNKAIEQHLRDSYAALLKSLGAGDGPPPYKKVELEQLQNIFDKGNFNSLSPTKQQEILDQLNAMMEHAGMNTTQRQAAFLATCAIESGELTMWHEGDYPGGPDDAWFNEHYGPQTPKGKELGNTEPGDGARFMGRGPIQVTGRDAYQHFTDWYNQSYHPTPPVDFTKTPKDLEDPKYGFAAAEWYWTSHAVNAAADSGGIDAVTDIVNCYDDNRDKKREVYEQALPILGG